MDSFSMKWNTSTKMCDPSWTVTMQFRRNEGRLKLTTNGRTIKGQFRLGVGATMGTTIFLQG